MPSVNAFLEDVFAAEEALSGLAERLEDSADIELLDDASALRALCGQASHLRNRVERLAQHIEKIMPKEPADA